MHQFIAFGMGYGETEKILNKYIKKALFEENSQLELRGNENKKPIVATKFTPIPWRRTAQSVVDACKQSCLNLGVDQIDLYQIHMPDSKYAIGTCYISILCYLFLTINMAMIFLNIFAVVQPLRSFGKVETKDSVYWDGIVECYNQ